MSLMKTNIKISIVAACLLCNISLANVSVEGDIEKVNTEDKIEAISELDIKLEETKGSYRIEGEKTGQTGLAVSPIRIEKPSKVISAELEGNIDDYVKVSLFDVVLEAVANSHNVKVAREKVRQAQITLDDAYSGYKPTLDAEYRYGRTHKTPGDEDKDDPTKKFNDETFKLQVKQNLYSGGATVNKIKGLEKSLEVSKNRYELAINQEVQNAIKAYFGVVFASQSLNATKANMEMLNKILEIVTVKYELGAASIGDLSSIKASVANAESKFSKTKSKFVESVKYYEYIVGEDFKFTLPYEYEFNTEIEPIESLLELANKQNINIVSYLINIEAEKYKLKSAESAFRPKIDLELTTTRTYDKDIEPEDLYMQDTKEAFITFKYNLYNGGVDTNKMKSVYSAIRELNYKVEEERRKVKWIISNLHQSLKALSSSISSTKEEVASSKTMVDSYWEAFKNGEQDLQTLLTAQRQLNSAEVSLIEFYENRLNDYFKLLFETGRLTSYFELEPYNDKYIDFSLSGYNNKYFSKVEKSDGAIIAKAEVTAPKDESKEVVHKVEVIDSMEDILVFKDRFLDADDNNFTIFVSDFETVYDAFAYMKESSLSKQAFIVDVLKDYKLRSVMSYGIFANEQEANDSLAQIKKLDSKQYEVVTIDRIKDLYRKFINGFDELKPRAIVQTKTIKMAPKPPKPYATDARFKQEFVNASSEYYTINLVTFANLDDAINLVDSEDIYDSSLMYRYGPNGEWIKIVYGVFSKYEDAHIALSLLSPSIKDKYYPVVEHIKYQQELYAKYKDLALGTPSKAKGAVEYMTVSEDVRIEEKGIAVDIDTKKSVLVDAPAKEKKTDKELQVDFKKITDTKVEQPKESVVANVKKEEISSNVVETPTIEQKETLIDNPKVEDVVPVQEEPIKATPKVEETVKPLVVEEVPTVAKILLEDKKTDAIEEVYFEDIVPSAVTPQITTNLKYKIDVTLLEKSKVKWFVQRYGISEYSTQDVGVNMVKILIGDFSDKGSAIQALETLHPHVNSISKIIEFSTKE